MRSTASRLAAVATAIAGARTDRTWLSFMVQDPAGIPRQSATILTRGQLPGRHGGIFVTHRAVSSLNDAVVARTPGRRVCSARRSPPAYRHCGQGPARGIRVPAPRNDARARDGPCDPRRRGDGPFTRSLYRIGRPARTLSRGCLKDQPRRARHRCTGSAGRRMCGTGRSHERRYRNLQIGSSSHTDVTGGMRGKIDELLGPCGCRDPVRYLSCLADLRTS